VLPKLSNPYRHLPEAANWRRSVAKSTGVFDPVVDVKFTIKPTDIIATAGSCFAQHISKHLVSKGYRFLIEESPVDSESPMYSARYGNIYTSLQLLQLIKRAYGMFSPVDNFLKDKDGHYLDPFRPQLFPGGFNSLSELLEERSRHYEAVRRVFETSDVFVFTLGLTERWVSEIDGAAFPLCPGSVATESEKSEGLFTNATVAEMTEELREFLGLIKEINPKLKMILTVSPVPLLVSASSSHVLLANTYSKSALRVVASTIENEFSNVMYFPSFEIIAGPQARSAYYAEDLRSVTPEGVAHVMQVFGQHLIADTPVFENIDRRTSGEENSPGNGKFVHGEFDSVICDEEVLDVDGAR